jgi:hypothetical protein
MVAAAETDDVMIDVVAVGVLRGSALLAPFWLAELVKAPNVFITAQSFNYTIGNNPLQGRDALLAM